MTRRDDAEEIDAGLRANIEGVLDQFAPGWVRHKGRGHPTGDASSSFMVTLDGKHRGGWNRFSQGIGGGPIKLLAFLANGQSGEPTSADYRQAFDDARRFLGMDSRPVDQTAALEAQRKAKEERERARAEAEARALADLERRQDNAWELWAHGHPLAGTAGELYLRNRGIVLEAWPEVMRFVPRIKHGPTGQWSSAILCRVDGPDGGFLGINRIYVTPDGQKAFGGNSKLTLGPIGGGAVRLWDPVGGEVSVCEGVETAFGIHLLTGGRKAVWALLGTSGMQGFEVPFEVDAVRIWSDGDMWSERYDERACVERISRPPGKTAAALLADRLVQEGTRVFQEESAEDGADFLDIWNFKRSLLQVA